MAIKLITFDLDDTLWDNHVVIRRAERACYEYLQQHAPELTKQHTQTDLKNVRLKIIEQEPHLQALVSETRKRSIQQALNQINYPSEKIEDVVKGAFDCFWQARSTVELFPQTLPLLKKLHEGYELGALTNGNSDLSKIGIAPYFSFFYSAEQLGICKPHADFFQIALDKAGVKPQETLHIGDSPLNDVYGAQQVGMHTVWFNPKNIAWEDAARKKPNDIDFQKPSMTVKCLSEIPKAIEVFTLK